MINKKILIFGATGQIGRYCIRRLVKNDYKVIAVTRNSHKAVFLKTQAPIGYLEIEEANIFDHERVENLVSKVDVCINEGQKVRVLPKVLVTIFCTFVLLISCFCVVGITNTALYSFSWGYIVYMQLLLPFHIFIYLFHFYRYDRKAIC